MAKHFGKEHRHVLRDIQEILESSPEKDRSNFGLISFPDTYGRQQPAYELTRAGFSILIMGFTGKEALARKWKYIVAFDGIEERNKKIFQMWLAYYMQDDIT